MSTEPQGLRLVDQNGAPLRIPKLTYRNRAPESEPVPLPTDSGSPGSGVHSGEPGAPTECDAVSANLARNDTQLPTQYSSNAHAYHGPRRSSASAVVGHDEENNSSRNAERKKRHSLFGFLSLKEPSTSALDEFARQQQKRAAAKGGRTTAVGLPGTSTTQRLPPSVPKVNSRWDGLPSPVLDRGKEWRSGKRDSTFTVASHSSASSSSPSLQSRTSSQASLGSGSSSVRFSSPLVDPISEVPERLAEQALPAVDESNTQGLSQPRQSWSVGLVKNEAPSTLVPQLQSGDYPEHSRYDHKFSNAVGEPLAEVAGRFGQSRRPLPVETQAIRIQEAEKDDTSPSNWQGPRLREQPRPSAEGHHVMLASGSVSDASLRASAPVPYNAAATTGHAHSSRVTADVMRLKRVEEQRTVAKAEVLPWEVQTQLPQDSLTHKDDEKRRKLGFLSRKHR